MNMQPRERAGPVMAREKKDKGWRKPKPTGGVVWEDVAGEAPKHVKNREE